MSEARRVPEVGEVITIPHGTDQEPNWYVKEVFDARTHYVVSLEHILDRGYWCTLLLWPDGRRMV